MTDKGTDALYPEHEKLRALRIGDDPFDTRNRIVGDFIEWLRGSGREIAQWHRVCGGGMSAPDPETRVTEWEECGAFLPDNPENKQVRCPACGRSRVGTTEMLPTHETTEKLVGLFFGIDPDKLNAEKDAMLAAIRAAQP